MTRTDWETEHPRKSVNLLPEQWERLDAIAAELASPATRGAAMEPSWRTLLRDIADGKLAVMQNAGDVYRGQGDCEIVTANGTYILTGPMTVILGTKAHP